MELLDIEKDEKIDIFLNIQAIESELRKHNDKNKSLNNNKNSHENIKQTFKNKTKKEI